MRPPAPATRVADAVVFAAFLAVPLVVTPALWDQFVTVKWYALEVVAACWLLAAAWAIGGGWPRFVRENRILCALAAALGLVSVFRSGAGTALAPLVERVSVLACALCAFWWVRRRQGELEPARTATALALAAVTAIGLCQALGHDPLARLNAGDHRGSTFGNANMAAQYAALALLMLVAPLGPRRPRWRAVAETAVVALAGLWLVLLGSRSVIVALGAGLVAMVITARRRVGSRGVAVLAAGLAVVAAAWLVSARLLDPEQQSRKTASASHRLHVWSDTLRLIADDPLGVGAGSFEDAYRPYQATGAAFIDERQVWRHPHNEYLRIAAEEGLPFLLVLAALIGRLAWRVAQAWRAEAPPAAPLVAAWTAFLAVEAFFQFPLALAFPSLATALLLGLALWHADGAPAPARHPALWQAAAALTAFLLLLGTARVAVSEWLFVQSRDDAAAQERACRLDPRNLPACVMAAWLRGATDVAAGRAQLVQVLRRAPHYPPAMKLLAQQAQRGGDHEAACVYMTAYDGLFRGQSSLHADLVHSCDEAARGRAAQRVPSPHFRWFPFVGTDAVAR